MYADFNQVNLTNADLTGALLDISKLEKAILCNTKMPDGSIKTLKG
jgi:uncharacterized protein YjbI with pentapeptide repeats